MIGYVVAVVLGFLVSYVELVSRYKNLWGIFKYKSAYFHFLIHAFASIAAYWILEKFYPTDQELDPLLGGLAAGLSALAILNLSIGSIKTGDKEVQVGFAYIFQVLLDATALEFDRDQSRVKLESIPKIMAGVSFESVKISLPMVCFDLMEHVTLQDQKALALQITDLRNIDIHEAEKSLRLGILLSKTTGEDLLRDAVGALRNLELEEETGRSSDTIARIRELKEKFR